MHRRGMFAGALLLFLFTTQPAWPSPANWLESFQKQLAELAERSRQNQDPEQGLAKATRLLQRLLDEVAGGQQACVLFARVELLRAIFEAKLQRWEDALWDYAVALNLDPEVAKFSFSDYPELAERFLTQRKRLLDLKGELKDDKKTQSKEINSTLPRAPSSLTALRTTQPKYPKGALKDRRESTVILGLVVNEKGIPTDPLFWNENCDQAAFFVAATEAVRSWAYEPVIIDGPKAVFAHVTVRFSLEGPDRARDETAHQ